MNNIKYEVPNEWLGTAEVTEYIFIIEDNSNRKDKQIRELEEKEKLRAIFLVKLIEEYNYLEKNIHLDVDVNNLTIDLLVYKNNKPFIAVDINQSNLEKTIAKAEKLGAEYAVIITKITSQFFIINPRYLLIPNIPKA